MTVADEVEHERHRADRHDAVVASGQRHLPHHRPADPGGVQPLEIELLAAHEHLADDRLGDPEHEPARHRPEQLEDGGQAAVGDDEVAAVRPLAHPDDVRRPEDLVLHDAIAPDHGDAQPRAPQPTELAEIQHAPSSCGIRELGHGGAAKVRRQPDPGRFDGCGLHSAGTGRRRKLSEGRSSQIVTWLLAVVLVAGFVWLSVVTRSSGTGGGCLMSHPYASTVRVLENMLRLEAAVHRFALPAEAAMFDAMGAGTDDTIDEALAAYQELLACEEEILSVTQRRSLQARVGVLLGEAGRLREARDHVAALSPPGTEGAVARAMRIAYDLPTVGADRRPLGDELRVLEFLGGGWTVDRLGVRLARRLGDNDEAEERLSSLDSRGRRRLSRLRAWAFLQLLLIVPGFAFLMAWLLGMRVRPRMSTGLIPAPWTTGAAVGVLVRAAFLGMAAFLGVIGLITVVARVEADTPGLTSGWATAVSLIPAVWLARRKLFLPHLREGEGLLDGLGVDPPHRSLPGLTVNSLMPVAGVLIGSILLRRVLWSVGVDTHFTDVIIEPLLWGGPVDAALVTIDVVAWAPLLEEIVFRGVIYATLRRHMPAAWAIPVSALLFGLPHLYSLGGTLEVVFSGMIFAVAYERTRSLAPAIAAHAVANASVVVGAMLILG